MFEDYFDFTIVSAAAEVSFEDDALILAVLRSEYSELRVSLSDSGIETPGCVCPDIDDLGGLFAPQSIDIYEG